MNAGAAGEQGVDTGLLCLVLMLRYTGVPADPAQLRHRFGNLSERITTTEILRTAKELGLKSRVVGSNWNRLAKSPLPAIAATKEGGFFIVAKVAEDKALIHDPVENRPVTMSRAELEAAWTGKLIFLAKRASLTEAVRKFDLGLVRTGDPQVQANPHRSAGGVFRAAALRPGLATVLPGDHRQGAGASRASPPWTCW